MKDIGSCCGVLHERHRLFQPFLGRYIFYVHLIFKLVKKMVCLLVKRAPLTPHFRVFWKLVYRII
jgi:hypothetical protein